MAVARWPQTATLLADGRVLITGSEVNSTESATAEVYDPATGTFSRTGSTHAHGCDPTATLLPDGRVLMAGGANPGEQGGDRWAIGLNDAIQMYDPVTGTFSLAGSMISTAGCHQSTTLLSNGRLLIVSDKASAELYDVATGRATQTGSMRAARSAATVTLLQDGRVLVTGGGIAQAEVYDPATGTFSTTGSMGSPLDVTP